MDLKILNRLEDFAANLFDFFRHYDEFAAADAEAETRILHEP